MEDATKILLDLAAMHQVRDEVAAILERSGKPVSNEKLAELLVAHRVRNGGEQRATAHRAGLARSSILQLEKGERHTLGIGTLVQVSYGYRIPFMRVLLAALRDDPTLPFTSGDTIKTPSRDQK